jgi:thiamine biosynthesis lipoprotein
VSNATFISALLLAVCAAAQEVQRFEAAEPHMGSITRITIYARDDSAIPAAFARIKELDEKLSDYKPDSELNRVCRTAHERPVKVSDDLFRVLEAAQQIAYDTDGAFDVTIGPLTQLWRQRKLPTPDAMSRVGYRNLVLDSKNRTVFLKLDGMQLDLGGIAKGFAADEALAVLRARGVPSALVAVSGDIAIGDAPPGKDGWTINVEGSSEIQTLHNVAVSTSGNTEQVWRVGDHRYAHIINPKTGRGFDTSDELVVSVIGPAGLVADPLATAIFLMDFEAGRAYAKRRGVTAFRVLGHHAL